MFCLRSFWLAVYGHQQGIQLGLKYMNDEDMTVVRFELFGRLLVWHETS
jgi:hypothetical protein